MRRCELVPGTCDASFEELGVCFFTSWKEWKSRVSAQKFLTSPEGGDGSVMVDDESDGGGEKERVGGMDES